MPAISSPAPSAVILVTGANGFLGSWIVRLLLEKGYSVRAAVRNSKKGNYLKDQFKSYGDKFEIAVVGDIGKDDAFVQSVQGVHGIIHTASPVSTIVDDPRDTADEEVTVSEEVWNEQRLEECNKLGKEASGLAKYSTSKLLAERAAWDFMQSNKERISWDLTTINPPWIFGNKPIIHEVDNPASLTSSSRRFWDAVVNNNFWGVAPLERPGHGWVDVRDVAEAHIKALETSTAGGERIIVTAGSWVWQDIINTAISLPSHIYKRHPAATGPLEVKSRLISWDTRKQERILGLKFRSMEELVHDTLANYSEHGWY
ncbi:hypothetical protein UA08_03127 [Talaromyces atroroseus]|uniref:NAD-dependent epimerase/dehydratase domain-containing protein n=1 Tax=Talaromyces atroroseus TaxID=1441469 RepID=A0A225AIU9_TALAT|nr:hypothetical protein UA08_03127 [Talaromyces atroroseus]OKL61381.1 hypothetical protein UA08_03127 [Talaromyces atroroseus]